MKQALGMVETRGLVALFEAVDAMLKAATVDVHGVGAGGLGPRDRVRRGRRGGGQGRDRRGRRGGGASSARWSACR